MSGPKNHSISIAGVSFPKATAEQADQWYQNFRDLLDMEIGYVGPKTTARLVREFGTVECIADQPTESLTTVKGVSESTAERIESALTELQRLEDGVESA